MSTVVIRLKLVSLQMDKQLIHSIHVTLIVVIRLKLVSLQMDKQPLAAVHFYCCSCDSLKISIFANG